MSDSMTVVCPNCGLQQTRGPATCSQCGGSLVDAKPDTRTAALTITVCGKCGVEVPRAAAGEACPRCGADLGDAKEVYLPAQRAAPSSWAGMGILGMIMLIAGMIGAIASLGYDTAPSGTHNIGLLNEKQNFVVISCAVAIIGGILTASPHAKRNQIT